MGGMIADYYQSVMDRYHFIPDKIPDHLIPPACTGGFPPKSGKAVTGYMHGRICLTLKYTISFSIRISLWNLNCRPA